MLSIFIDMGSSKNQRDVENRLKEALQADRARIQVGRISRFGLLEMSRQRLRLSLGEAAQEVCPRCEGRGAVRNIQSHSLSITRLIEEEALKEKTAEIQVQLPAEMATYIMNEKRTFIRDIEKRHHVSVVIIANPYLHAPQYSITRLKEDNVGKNKKPSYSLIQQPELQLIASNEETAQDEPAVKSFAEHQPIKHVQNSFIKRLWTSLFGNHATTVDEEKNESPKKHPERQQPMERQHNRNPERRSPNNNRRRRPNNNNPQQRASSNTNNNNNNNNQARKKAPSQQHQNQNRNPNGKNEAAKKRETPVKESAEK